MVDSVRIQGFESKGQRAKSIEHRARAQGRIIRYKIKDKGKKTKVNRKI